MKVFKNPLRFTALIAILSITIFSLTAQSFNQDFTPDRKIDIVTRIISSYYVDSLNMDSVVEQGIIAMLKTLDPHSSYSNPEETKALTEPLEGNFSGVGIQFNMLTDTLYVIQTVAGGPSEKVGIMAGDRIITVNDTLIAGIKKPNAEVIKMLRGPKGSEVTVEVMRRGVPELIKFRIVRDDIPIYSVDAAFMADPTTGYISLSRFADSSAKEVAEAMAKLYKQGMKNLILNLEDNGGGYLGAAFNIAGMFLPENAPVVYTHGLNQPMQRFNNEQDGFMTDGRVIVMVNQNSASASEIVSGALQDNDRALIVGRRTYGKGLVQRPFPLPDGSMVRLTTAHYYTPSGRSIQKPYTNGRNDDYYADIRHRYDSGELMNEDSVKLNGGQLHHTLNLRRPVYGGGGIMPDKFVPIDTSYYTTYYRDLVARGVIIKFAQNYVDLNRKEIKKQYKTETDFINKFEITDDMLARLVEMGQSEDIAPNPEAMEISGPFIRLILKGLIGRDIYDDSTYQRVVIPLNPTFREALQLINSPEYDTLLSASEQS